MYNNLKLKKLCKKFYRLIKKSKTIYIASHNRPDGDAIGSMFSMYYALKSIGKDASVVMPSFSKRYNFIEDIKIAKQKIEEEDIDLLICVDTSDIKIINISQEDFKKARNVVSIDHHKKNNIDASLKIHNEASPANCELLYDIYKCLKIQITKEIANYLYLGLMTDTGSFNYERTTAKSYKIASKLIEKGADFVKICKMMNDTIPEPKMKLLAYVIENMETYMDGKIRLVKVDKKTLDKLGVTSEDAEGMSNYLRMIEKTKVAIYARGEMENKYKVSMRSDGKIDISHIAIAHKGGGHMRAAGFDSYDIDSDINEVLKEVERIVESENNRNP